MDDCAGCSLVQRVQRFLASPFHSTLSALDWFLIVGLILVASYVWSRVVRTIEKLL